MILEQSCIWLRYKRDLKDQGDRTMKLKKSFALVTMIAFAAAPAHAGGVAEPVMEPEVIVEESSASSGGYLLPLLLIAVLVAVASSGGSDAPPVSLD